jgi:hypothetical protein
MGLCYQFSLQVSSEKKAVFWGEIGKNASPYRAGELPQEAPKE